MRGARRRQSYCTADMRVTLAIAAAALLVAMATTVDAAAECKPGDTKTQHCNTCYCNPAGFWDCSLRNCRARREAEEPAVVRRQAQHCSPGQSYKKDCNTCTCNKEGTAAICTQKACLNRSRRQVYCTLGTTYKDKCNTCRCSSDGRYSACTLKSCHDYD